jgi:hypothetical protein
MAKQMSLVVFKVKHYHDGLGLQIVRFGLQLFLGDGGFGLQQQASGDGSDRKLLGVDVGSLISSRPRSDGHRHHSLE